MLRRMSVGSFSAIGSSFRSLKPTQRHAFLASFLGWSLDSLDFFLLVFCIPAIAAEFHAQISSVAEAVFLTLVFRPLGALIFGAMADKWGRKPTLIVNIIAYSAVELSCAFAPSLHVLLILRALFGVAMGGVWGVGSSLAMEAIKKEARGMVSGLLQSGYTTGNLLAAVAYGVLFPLFGWRGMFMAGILPAIILIPFIMAAVPESPSFVAAEKKPSTFGTPSSRLPLAQ